MPFWLFFPYRACVFYFFKFIFNWRIIALQYCLSSCHIAHGSAIGISMSPSSWTSSHLTPQPIPLGCHRAHDLSSLHHTGNFRWLFNFTHGNVSMLFSQFVPPSPSCIVSTSLSLHSFYLNAFLFTQSLEYYQDVSWCASLLYCTDRTQRVLCVITLLCFSWSTHVSHIGSSGYILHGS